MLYTAIIEQKYCNIREISGRRFGKQIANAAPTTNMQTPKSTINIVVRLTLLKNRFIESLNFH